ncbi:23S ribosomal RNA methyltransferase Erm [Luteipulveratus mongoliensis]|uniref:Ribosomal RNA adenine methylase transferase N-terminal domain-containing protein n=1 Tax=Luteipulveratus mongoliensis TaxID=571913 RepID=A0A0K1JF97_9MICO|nr:23S ribosomal RNA methyltransferase Erm [Luteipulveratus mongoliensis]AKU15260.1 hypothetical protein VV02_04275 [Luteipulveratus mongoliensis]
MCEFQPGRHELGQNFLVDRAAIRAVTSAVAETCGPILELAAGGGALTEPLSQLGRSLTAVEVDPRQVRALKARIRSNVSLIRDDILRHAPPRDPHVVVCNVPFHITTPILRRLLGWPDWTDAVLITQWEVARKRAGVGGATMLTAQWWPWYDVELVRRIPASAFRPRPSVDAGLLCLRRRSDPQVRDRTAYQGFVRAVFTGPGRGLPDVVRRTGVSPRRLRPWCREHGVTDRTLPRNLTAAQWISLFELRQSTHPAG